MIIRQATVDDVLNILEIYNDAILNTTAVYEYQAHTLEMRNSWFAEKVKNNIPVLVAEWENQVVGFATYGVFRAWAAYQYSVEHSVYVHPQFKQKGIGKNLLKSLIKIIENQDIHTIIAGIDAENYISIHLHKDLGFTEVGHLKQVGYKFGKWLDLKIFQLILDNNLQPHEN